jgi:hypothetical protein
MKDDRSVGELTEDAFYNADEDDEDSDEESDDLDY